MKRKIKVGQLLVDKESGRKFIALKSIGTNILCINIDNNANRIFFFSKEFLFENLKKETWFVHTPYEL